MGYDYDKLYGETPNALGAQTKVFTDFFARFQHSQARVLDVGCGQGRDALFIARLGHSVVGVDMAPNGIRDLKSAALKENLSIEGVVADIVTYEPNGQFDVILIDRTLHMLGESDRLKVLKKLLGHIEPKGYLLIADEKSNIQGFERVIAKDPRIWTAQLKDRGYLFLQRA